MVEKDTGGMLFEPELFNDRMYNFPAVAPATAATTAVGVSPSCNTHDRCTSNVVPVGPVNSTREPIEPLASSHLLSSESACGFHTQCAGRFCPIVTSSMRRDGAAKPTPVAASSMANTVADPSLAGGDQASILRSLKAFGNPYAAVAVVATQSKSSMSLAATGAPLSAADALKRITLSICMDAGSCIGKVLPLTPFAGDLFWVTRRRAPRILAELGINYNSSRNDYTTRRVRVGD